MIEQETKILSQGMQDDELKKNKKSLEEQAKKRIKTGLILNAFGEKNNIKVSQEEINVEIQKQFRMMPWQEKIVKEYYEKNPSAIDSLKGQIYEEKILEEIKKGSKVNIKEITKNEAEKILKEENEKNLKDQEKLMKHDHVHHNDHDHELVHAQEKIKKKEKPKQMTTSLKLKQAKKLKTTTKKTKKAKKVSKK